MRSRRTPATARHGITLIEVIIVAAVMSLLAAVAWPSFQQSVQRSRRADGMAALNEIMQAQERWRADNPTYQGTLSSLRGARSQSADGHYTLSLSNADNQGYTAQATARSGSPQARDTRCQVLQVTVQGGNIRYSSLATGGNANAAPDPCWVR